MPYSFFLFSLIKKMMGTRVLLPETQQWHGLQATQQSSKRWVPRGYLSDDPWIYNAMKRDACGEPVWTQRSDGVIAAAGEFGFTQ